MKSREKKIIVNLAKNNISSSDSEDSDSGGDPSSNIESEGAMSSMDGL